LVLHGSSMKFFSPLLSIRTAASLPTSYECIQLVVCRHMTHLRCRCNAPRQSYELVSTAKFLRHSTSWTTEAPLMLSPLLEGAASGVLGAGPPTGPFVGPHTHASVPLSPLALLLSAALILITAGVSVHFSLGLHRTLAVASFRCASIPSTQN
jgi:hypothetical protein